VGGKAVIVAGLVVAAVASAYWIRERVAEGCPDLGTAASLDVSVTERALWRFADVRVGSRHYTIEPHVNADFGTSVTPIPLPLPQSHHVAVGVTIQSTDEEAVRAWRTSCLRMTHGRDSVSRRAAASRDVLTSSDGSFHYRFDGASDYPEWPPDEAVDVEITFVVDGSPFVMRILSVPIVRVG
jgi:hypothetical protein